MATINFFVAESELPVQSVANNYGPVSSTQYRVSSIFNGSLSGNDPMAYAVTSGKIFIVNQANTNRVNLILKPYDDIQGMPLIKYFIYRGLRKDDFLNAADGFATIKPVNATTDSDLIKEIRKGQSGINALNVYTSLADTKFIDELFIKEENQFHFITGGKSLGRFGTVSTGQEYAFEIILQEAGYNPTLGIARKQVNIIDIPASSNGADNVARESVLAYLDPAAYYGNFAQKNFLTGTNNTSGSKTKSREKVYDLVKKFSSRNTVYLDLRDLQGNSLNWFTNNPQTIKRTVDNSPALNAAAVNYSTNNGYPLHTISSGFQNTAVADGQRYFTLALSFSAQNNTTPMLALHCGLWKDFFPDMRSDIIFSKCTINSGWTVDQQFSICAADDSGNYVPIASYLRVQLLKYVSENALGNPVPTGDPFDVTLLDFGNLFSPNPIYVPEYGDITIQNKPINVV